MEAINAPDWRSVLSAPGRYSRGKTLVGLSLPLAALVLGAYGTNRLNGYSARFTSQLDWAFGSRPTVLLALVLSTAVLVLWGVRWVFIIVRDIAEPHQAKTYHGRSEAMMGRLFDAIPDIVVHIRLSDGKLLEVNDEFLRRTGLSREKAVSTSVLQIGLWAHPEDRHTFVQKLKSDGRVCNMETAFRLRDVVVPYLLSAVAIDVDGEARSVLAARDMTQIKESERELRKAQQRLCAQVEELTATEARLRAEVRGSETAERLAQEREATLRKIFEASLDCITIRRLRDGRFLDVNKEFLRTIGYSREEVLGRTAEELGGWADPAQFAEYSRKVRTDGRARNMEADFRVKSGHVVPGLISAEVVELGGEPCVVSVMRDISTIRAMERELIAAREVLAAEVRDLEESRQRLSDSEAKLRKVLEATGDAITINRLSDGRYLDLNQGFCDVTGYTREEVLGRSAGDIGIWAHREQLRRFLRLLKAEGKVRNFEGTLQLKGERLADHLISASVVEMDGETCVVTASRDVGEMKKAEQELRAARDALASRVRALNESQDRLRSEIAERELTQRRLEENEATLRKVFDTSLDIISINRLSDGLFVAVNDEFVRATGYSRVEALASTGADLRMFKDRTRMRAMMEQLRTAGLLRNFQIEIRTKDGRVIPHLFSGAVVNVAGEPCVIAIIRDISTLKQAERDLITAREAALAASEAKSEFLSSMSHEIRTPMNAILGMADVMWDSQLSGEQRRYLDIMRSNGNSLLCLINDILDVAKIESGRLSLESVGFDLKDVVDRTVETMAVRAKSKGLGLTARILPTAPLKLRGDPLRLRQILINLLGNAIKFTANGEVSLTVGGLSSTDVTRSHLSMAQACADESAAPPAWLRFAVSDTGIGIPADKLSTIFSGFSQADASISRRYGGSGLGLTIVKRLSELMGGRVEVESEVGRGSTFRLTVALGVAQSIPETHGALVNLAGVAAVEQSSSTSEEPAARPATAPLHILLAEDSLDNRFLIATYLKNLPYELEVAEDGRVAIDKFKSSRYDLVLMDMQMPQIDGLTATRTIRQWESERGLSPTPIIALTASALEDDVQRSLAAGCNAQASKPIKRRILLEMIQKTLAPRPAPPALTAPEIAVDSLLAVAAKRRVA